MFGKSVLLSFVWLCSATFAFDAGWTGNFLVTNYATHYSLTECALLQLSADYLRDVYSITSIHSSINIQNGSCQTSVIFEKIGEALAQLQIDKKHLALAIETITQANTNRDLLEPLQYATHFHNEEIGAGALLVSQRLEAAVTNMQTNDYEAAREAFGAMLHSVQDFYSHTNWIEIGYRVPNQGMGKYQNLGTVPWKGIRTCVNCAGEACRNNFAPTVLESILLTSGYYGLRVEGETLDANLKPIGKCSHGGPDDYTVDMDASGGGINKDTLTSDHGHLHQLAASVAYNATVQILNEFRTTIGQEAFGSFLGLATTLQNASGNSLIIVMDDTGSMGPYIAMAKQIAISIVNTFRNLTYPPSNYILSPFNDPTWGPLTISDTPEQFVAELDKLYAHGGDDEPELYYHGILEALKVCEVGSVLYAFTDAPAKDAYLKGQAVQLAKEKRVTITLFYARPRARQEQTGRSSPSPTDVIEYLDVTDGNDLSSITGGVLMGIDEQALAATTNFIIQNLAGEHPVTVVTAAASNLNISFHVDSSITSLKIELTSRSVLDFLAFSLIKPNSVPTVLLPTAQTPYMLMYVIPVDSMQKGQWTLLSQMNTLHTVQINAQTDLMCSSTLQKEIGGGVSNLSFTPLTTQPVQQDRNLFVLTICDKLPSELKTGYVNLLAANNGSAVIQKLTPMQVSATGFLSRITVPTGGFRLSSVIQLEDDTIIQRGTKEIVTPTSISLIVDNQPYFVVHPNTTYLNYTIHNAGSTPLTITLRVTDTMNLLPSIGVTKTYLVPASNRTSDSLALITGSLADFDANTTILTDSVVFSLAALDYTYDENVPVYIMRKETHLTNQTDSQQPPIQTTTTTTITTVAQTTAPSVINAATNWQIDTVFMTVFLCISFCLF